MATYGFEAHLTSETHDLNDSTLSEAIYSGFTGECLYSVDMITEADGVLALLVGVTADSIDDARGDFNRMFVGALSGAGIAAHEFSCEAPEPARPFAMI